MRPKIKIKIPIYSTRLIVNKIPIKFSQLVQRHSFTSCEHVGRFRERIYVSNKVVILSKSNY